MVLNLITGAVLAAGTTLGVDSLLGNDDEGFSLMAAALGAAVLFTTATVSHRVFF